MPSRRRSIASPAQHCWLNSTRLSDPIPENTAIEFGNGYNTGSFVVGVACSAVSLGGDAYTITFNEAGIYHVRTALQFSNGTFGLVTQCRVSSFVAMSTGGNFSGWLGGDPDPACNTPANQNEDQIFHHDWSVSAGAFFTLGFMLMGVSTMHIDGVEMDIIKY